MWLNLLCLFGGALLGMIIVSMTAAGKMSDLFLKLAEQNDIIRNIKEQNAKAQTQWSEVHKFRAEKEKEIQMLYETLDTICKDREQIEGDLINLRKMYAKEHPEPKKYLNDENLQLKSA